MKDESEQHLDRDPASRHLLENMDRILEYREGILPVEERGLLEEHLKECPECRAFQQKAERLEVELARNINGPALPPEFTTRLWERINSLPELESIHDEQRRRMELEFQKNSARLRKQLFRLPNVLDYLSYAAAVVIAGYLLVRLALEFPAKWLPGIGENHVMLGAWVAGAAVVICGLAFAMNQRWVRWFRST